MVRAGRSAMPLGDRALHMQLCACRQSKAKDLDRNKHKKARGQKASPASTLSMLAGLLVGANGLEPSTSCV